MAETVGWLADKISIMELKIFHMSEQIDRGDVTAEFRAECQRRVAVLREQRDDIAAELTSLLSDIAVGRVVPKVYRQYKMYNDPRYRAGPGTDERGGGGGGGKRGVVEMGDTSPP